MRWITLLGASVLCPALAPGGDLPLILNAEHPPFVVQQNRYDPAKAALARETKPLGNNSHPGEVGVFHANFKQEIIFSEPVTYTYTPTEEDRLTFTSEHPPRTPLPVHLLRPTTWVIARKAKIEASYVITVYLSRSTEDIARISKSELGWSNTTTFRKTVTTLDFPGINCSGPVEMTDNWFGFRCHVKGGFFLQVKAEWPELYLVREDKEVGGAPGYPGYNSTALDAIDAEIRKAYRSKMQAEVLAFSKQVKINPELYGLSLAQPVTDSLEFATDPAGKQSLRADGKDGVYVKARALPAPGEKSDSVAARTQAITFASAGPAKAWVDFGAPAVDGPWKKVYLQASNPDKVRGSAIPPPSVEIQATLKTAEQTLTKSLTLALTPNPTIDAKPDLVEFTLQSGQTAEVKVSLENPGPEKWQFRTEYEPTSRALAKAAIKATDASQAVLTLKEAGLEALHDGSNTEYATLRILAEQKDREPLERDIKVAVAQEGLFVASTGRDAQTRRFNVTADGKASPRDIDFRIFAQDPTSKRILNLTKNPATLAQVTVECLEDPASLAGRLIAAGQLTWKLAGLRSSNQPSAILRLACARELPSDGRTVPCDFRITYTGGQDESFSALVTVGLVTTANGPGGRDWQIELEKCQTIIRKFVPAAYQPKMRELLDRRKQTLGPEGLHALRERIWVAAAELTLGEGGRGYADEARWANYITESLEWTQWAGDLAFTAAIGTVTGPYGAMGASSLKGMILSALTAYQDGQTPEEWLWGNLSTIPGILEGKVIDPDTFEQLGMQHKAKIWAVFVSYHFLKNLYQGQTVVESLKSTAKEVAGNLLGSWLGTEVKKNGQRAAGGWAVDKVKGAASTLASAAKGGKAVPPAKPAAAPTPAAKPAQPAGKPTPAKAVPVAKETPPSTATKPGTKVSPAAKSSGAGDTGNGSGKAKAPDSPATSSKPSTDTPAEPAPGAAGSKPKAPAPEPTGTKPAAPASKPAEPAGPKTGADPASKPADAGAAPVVSDAAKRVQQRMQRAGDGAYYAHRDDVLSIMRDPSMVRALKNAPPEIQAAFANTRESLYRQHDCELAQYVKDHVPDMKYRMVKVMEFRTPGADGPSLNTDRDYRVCYYAGRDPNNGQEMWIEVPRRHWEDHSYQTFSQLTGGPNGTPAQNKEWAADHQQLATDRYHPEASPAFTDQKTVWNPKTRQFDKVQVTSNFTRVGKNQQEGLDVTDPQALGQMYVVKVADAKFRHEALVQANKAVTALIDLRKSYNVQGREIGKMPEKMLNGMVAVSNACAKLKADPNCRDPVAIAKAERILRENGFSSLGDFMQKMSGQFESLKFMAAGKGAGS